MNKYFTILTSVGEAKLANATALGETVKFTELAVGDGNGSLPTPEQSQTALVNEVRRKALNSVAVDENNPNWIMCEQVIPENVGGWTIREVGIFDGDGDLIAVGNFPETYKPVLEEGSGRTQTIRVVLQISATSSVELKIDPSVVLATREYVDDQDNAHTAADDPHPQYADKTSFEKKMSTLQFDEYNPKRKYALGETCWTRKNGNYQVWEWYSNVESLAGKDPLDTANRRVGWSDTTKPFYWKPYAPKVPSETMAWDTDDIPENMVVGMGQQLPVAVYHSLASAKPSWIDGTDNTLINIPDRRGRFVRAANGTNWIAGNKHGDFIRNIVGNVYNISEGYGKVGRGDGAFQKLDGPTDNFTPRTPDNGVTGVISFNAARVVPTSSENMPKGYIEWAGYAL